MNHRDHTASLTVSFAAHLIDFVEIRGKDNEGAMASVRKSGRMPSPRLTSDYDQD